MSFNGGTFATGGKSEGSFDGLTGAGIAGIGAASLANDSIIDFGLNAAGSVAAFADSSLATWTAGKTLKIYNWSGNPTLGGGTDRLFVGSDLNGLTATQLSQVQFFQGIGLNPLLGGALILPTGEIVPGPGTDHPRGSGPGRGRLLRPSSQGLRCLKIQTDERGRLAHRRAVFFRVARARR